jgi:hypothetical protein
MQQLSIGAFSRLTHLSIKTLRYYHEAGLLEPAVVDPDSGYRSAGGLFDDELFTREAGHARVYLPVTSSPALADTGVRWDLPAGRFAVALHLGPHRDVDRTYAALGTYADAHGRDGSGPVRERCLADPLDTPDTSQWQTEVCWPLAALGAQAN